MTSNHSGLLRPRTTFLSSGDTAAHAVPAAGLLDLLLHQDGSTTRIFEKLAGGPVTVHVLQQGVVHVLPSQLAGSLPGQRFLRRLVTLEAHGHVLLDALSYIAIDALPPEMVRELEEGGTPIGHLLARLWVKRNFRSGDTQLFEQLWPAVGTPDPRASRSFSIHTPDACCMVMAETFRRGVLEVAEGIAKPASV